jgi:hypothetical protein
MVAERGILQTLSAQADETAPAVCPTRTIR